MHYQLPWSAIKAFEVALLFAEGDIPCGPHPVAATQLVLLVSHCIVLFIYLFIYSDIVAIMLINLLVLVLLVLVLFVLVLFVLLVLLVLVLVLIRRGFELYEYLYLDTVSVGVSCVYRRLNGYGVELR